MKKKQRFQIVKDRSRKREGIFVAVPTMTNTISVQLSAFLLSCRNAELDASTPYTFEVEYCNGMHPVEFARNYLVGRFLASRCSRLWFFDDDMLPAESAALLLSVESDICAGKMFKFDHEDKSAKRLPGISICAGHNVDGTGRFRPLVPNVGDPMIQEVDVVGTASMVIRRAVLEDKRMWLPGKYVGRDGEDCDFYQEKEEHGWCPPIFRTRYKPNGQCFKGEDIDFCDRAKELGYSVKIHLGAEVGHQKTVDLDQVVSATHTALERYKEFHNIPFDNFYRRELKRCGLKQ